jgi:hypothetical protein
MSTPAAPLVLYKDMLDAVIVARCNPDTCSPGLIHGRNGRGVGAVVSVFFFVCVMEWLVV